MLLSGTGDICLVVRQSPGVVATPLELLTSNLSPVAMASVDELRNSCRVQLSITAAVVGEEGTSASWVQKECC